MSALFPASESGAVAIPACTSHMFTHDTYHRYRSCIPPEPATTRERKQNRAVLHLGGRRARQKKVRESNCRHHEKIFFKGTQGGFKLRPIAVR